MDERLTHVSFFAGIGGFDLGFERADWRTVAYSEINPFAIAVFETHWPSVPNLGCIKSQVGWLPVGHAHDASLRCLGGVPNLGDILRLRDGLDAGRDASREPEPVTASREWHRAVLWTGGFPCQDLSVAGKRKGLAGERSGLAFAFLTLVGRHRPQWVLLENVPGLLSSHHGRDMARLVDELANLGYGVAWRVLDARWFGLAQRRRRVFILATRDPGGRAGALRAAAVLFEPASGGGDTAQGGEARAGTPEGVARSLTGTQYKRHDDDTDTLVVGAERSVDTANGQVVASPLEASDGHHGRSSPRGDGADNLVVGTLNSGGNDGGFRTEPGEHLVVSRDSVPKTADGLVTDLRSGNPHPSAVLVSPPPDSRGVRAPTGLPRRMDAAVTSVCRPGRTRLCGRGTRALRATREENSEAETHSSHPAQPVAFDRYNGTLSAEVPTLPASQQGGFNHAYAVGASGQVNDDPLLPRGLDSARYRVLGNAVAVPVAEWIGRRLAEEILR